MKTDANRCSSFSSKYCMFVCKDPKGTISSKMEKREIKSDYFGYVAKEDIKRGELLLEEEAFSYAKTPGAIPLTDWAECIKRNFSKGYLELLWPRSLSEGLAYWVTCDCFNKKPEELLRYFVSEAKETKGSTLMLPMIISKVHANYFSSDSHLESLLFFRASFFNSCDPENANVRFTITSEGDKRKITMKAKKYVKAGEELAFFYSHDGIKFLEK